VSSLDLFFNIVEGTVIPTTHNVNSTKNELVYLLPENSHYLLPPTSAKVVIVHVGHF
jgi:hypothetical protein